MRINSILDVKCFCNNKNVLRAQSMVLNFGRHPVEVCIYIYIYICTSIYIYLRLTHYCGILLCLDVNK